MIGTMRINVIVASLAGLFTFALSIGNNLLLSTLLKSVYAFLILFVLTFGFRWVLGLVAGAGEASAKTSADPMQENGQLGQNLDMVTPNEDGETLELMKSNLSNQNADSLSDMQFSPLNPPKLVTKKELDPEQLAGALRRMSED
ncbi:hypothetical protein [Paenibacillus whitsoniae]|uniref:Uncharacterized protein n=1 Tax=Paenibacillus whitsoniae TaxID=2496558 RepID=A0A3S0AJV5_9BACL|nr:hypothetical protein [Paenibacillus whitsoniae]RTE01801.1 hypothetical protein EJQ19_30610 [Paenibacillus whitsoniae]